MSEICSGSKQAWLPGAVTTFTHPGRTLSPPCPHVQPGHPGTHAVCVSALLTVHPMVHQTSLMKGKCKMNCSMVKNFEVVTALTRAHGHKYEAHAQRSHGVGFKDPPCGGGMGAGQGFPAHAAPGSVLSRADDCRHCWSVEGLWGCTAQQKWQW